MTLLVVGVMLWMAVHLIPAVARPLRQSLIDKLGNNVYRGVFALAIVASLAIIVLGWRSAPEEYVYVLPSSAKTVGFILICLSFLIIGSAYHPSSIKRFIRHPMLTGVFVWALSHLLTNGTTRALVLFGGIGIWALIEIPLINRREGAYTKPEAPDFHEELKGLFFSAGILMIVLFLHPYFTGVTPFPR
jgi:uncharacterized membrane protein